MGGNQSPGLEGALGRHIARAHAGEIEAHNASLAVSLVEGAITRLFRKTPK